MTKTALKVVKTDTRKTKKKAPNTVTYAVQHGTQKDILVAMRDRIAKAIDDPATPAREFASLTKRLMDINKELAQMEAAEKEQEAFEHDTSDEEWEAI